MSDLTREEMQAELKALAAQTETKYVALTGKIDRISDQITSAVQVLSLKTETAIDASKDAKAAATAGKWQVSFLLFAIFASLIGVWAIWQDGLSMLGTLWSANPPAVAVSPQSPPDTAPKTQQ